MKKIIALAAAAVMVLSFGGCSSGTGTNVSSEVAMANPWTEYKTLEEAQTAVGFEIQLPDEMKKEASGYRTCEGVNTLELQEVDGAYIRKAKDDGDISGDYQEYKYVKDLEKDGVTYTVKGDSSELVNLVTWNIEKYSYCIGGLEGISEDKAVEMASEIK